MLIDVYTLVSWEGDKRQLNEGKNTNNREWKLTNSRKAKARTKTDKQWENAFVPEE